MITFQPSHLIGNFGPNINCVTMRALIDIRTPKEGNHGRRESERVETGTDPGADHPGGDSAAAGGRTEPLESLALQPRGRRRRGPDRHFLARAGLRRVLRGAPPE